MTIYTFFDSSLDAPANQAEQLRLWERNWRARGWTPKLLTVRHARQNKKFKELQEKHPGKSFESSAFWFALHKAGGGWFVHKNQGECPLSPKRSKTKKLFVSDNVFYLSRTALEEIFFDYFKV